MPPTHKTILFLRAPLLFSRCMTDIQHGLNESEANDILVLLQSHGLNAAKEQEGGGTGEVTWKVVTRRSEGTRSWQLLKEAELPKPRLAGLEIFNRGSLIPT